MIRLRVADVLRERGWTAYRLAKEASLTMPVAYRLADPKGDFRRLDLGTLNAICAALDVQPGELLEWVPEQRRGPGSAVRPRTRGTHRSADPVAGRRRAAR